MKAIQLNATKREKSGKGASRAVRRSGFVPAVVYGDKLAPEMISIEEKILVAEMGKKGIWTRQYEINVDGKDKHLVLCQDIQKHPVSNRPIHADFLRISKNSLLTLEVPVQFIGEGVAPALKRVGCSTLCIVLCKLNVRLIGFLNPLLWICLRLKSGILSMPQIFNYQRVFL